MNYSKIILKFLVSAMAIYSRCYCTDDLSASAFFANISPNRGAQIVLSPKSRPVLSLSIIPERSIGPVNCIASPISCTTSPFSYIVSTAITSANEPSSNNGNIADNTVVHYISQDKKSSVLSPKTVSSSRTCSPCPGTLDSIHFSPGDESIMSLISVQEKFVNTQGNFIYPPGGIGYFSPYKWSPDSSPFPSPLNSPQGKESDISKNNSQKSTIFYPTPTHVGNCFFSCHEALFACSPRSGIPSNSHSPQESESDINKDSNQKSTIFYPIPVCVGNYHSPRSGPLFAYSPKSGIRSDSRSPRGKESAINQNNGQKPFLSTNHIAVRDGESYSGQGGNKKDVLEMSGKKKCVVPN